MKIMEAIQGVDALLHNTYGQDQKIKWLSVLDSMVKRTVIDTHEGADAVNFTKYDDSTDINTVLLIPEPFDEAYPLWLEAKIHYYNGEYDKYNNATEAFNTFFAAFKNEYNRQHMPIGKKFQYF